MASSGDIALQLERAKRARAERISQDAKELNEISRLEQQLRRAKWDEARAQWSAAKSRAEESLQPNRHAQVEMVEVLNRVVESLQPVAALAAQVDRTFNEQQQFRVQAIARIQTARRNELLTETSPEDLKARSVEFQQELDRFPAEIASAITSWMAACEWVAAAPKGSAEHRLRAGAYYAVFGEEPVQPGNWHELIDQRHKLALMDHLHGRSRPITEVPR